MTALATETRLLTGRVAHLRPDGSLGDSPRTGRSLGLGRILTWDWKDAAGGGR